MTEEDSLALRIHRRLEHLYGDRAQQVTSRILALMDPPIAASHGRTDRWDERDVVLIAYGDQIQEPERPPLVTLDETLCSRQLDDCFSTVHILPFCPSSSDDGFSVIDYLQVDPALGSWADVGQLGERFDLMFDLVLNHISQHSDWFQAYLAGIEPYTRFFIEADPRSDLSKVVRPRSLPLLTPFETAHEDKHVWTTFSADQIDLNFAEPDVLIRMIDVLLSYVRRGARIVRLDAIAYLWKQLGTPCIHLPQTHEVVKLMRDVLDAVAPHVILLTETNVPHAENVSYLSDGDEAHMVYQFSLPPLLLDAVLNQDTGPLQDWLLNLEAARPGTTYFNFTASHDGVGVRPLEGLIAPERLARLVDAVRQRGGLISTRRQGDGTDSPYELNVSYLDACGDPSRPEPAWQAKRFLATQAVMLALRGIPGVYFHSLIGTPNDLEGARSSGQPRRINRRKYRREELLRLLSDRSSLQSHVFRSYRRMLKVRAKQPAFHPDGGQEVWSVEDPSLLVFRRRSVDGRQTVLVAANLSDQPRELNYAALAGSSFKKDILSPDTVVNDTTVRIQPFQVVWLCR